jgi:tetratricopeptide (TPR) repeat protein
MNFKPIYLLFPVLLLVSSTTAFGQETLCERLASDGSDAQQLKHDIVAAENLFIVALKNEGGCRDETLLTITTNLGGIYANQKRFAEAEPLFREALTLAKKVKGENHPDIALYLSNLAIACGALNKSTEADAFFRESISRLEKTGGERGRRLGRVLETYAKFLRNEHRITEADEMERRSKSILDQPITHPRVIDP